MPHRSNQAVASQDQAAPQPPAPDPPPRQKLLISWATALAALVVSTAALAAVLWLARLSIAELLIGAALSERGAAADFRVTELDFNHAILSGVRFGDETAPDAAIALVEARWSWSGIAPRLHTLRIVEPRVRLTLDRAGRVSVGALDNVRGRPSARRPTIPAIRLEIVDGEALIAAPFGTLNATFQSHGALGRDFSASARIVETNRPGRTYALERGRAELLVVSRDDTIAFRLNGDVGVLRWDTLRLNSGALRVLGRAPLDLSRYDIEAAWRVMDFAAPRVIAHNASGAIGFEAVARDGGLDPDVWQGQARTTAARLTLTGNTISAGRFEAHAEGREGRGRGAWTLSGEHFAGLALTSAQPSAAGDFTLNLNDGGAFNAGARVSLAQSRMDAGAQQRIRDAFPSLPQAPVGPQFAQAEHALDAAADRFDLTGALQLRHDGAGTRLVVNAPIEAHAASGARVRLTPLRRDLPALSLEWPSLALTGAISIEISGGGAPATALLLDRVAWAPQQRFEADGTLSLSNWRADGASIAADELDVTLVIAPEGGGQLELHGSAEITGPIGEGQVRDLVAALDLAVSWGDGWSVRPARGCVPVRVGGLSAAGLTFLNGAFALCALDGALIAANARGQLSGGFAVQALALNGRMAGPDGQPARLAAQRVTGRFSGAAGDILLAMQAEAPRLTITMAEERALNVVLRRLTAEARIAGTWRVEGGFESGVLTDPSLPGAVSAILGRWSAAPADGRPVIRVEAAEALLTADEPDVDERLLFHNLRLAEVNAQLRAGTLTAEGAIQLEESGRQLARFTAMHDVSAGRGVAEINAPQIVFDADFQPYALSELARGLIENVRGPIALNAGVTWTRREMRASGVVRLNGVSLATSTIPDVRGVRGDVFFDDLFAMTTAPGQVVRIESLNPGVTVRNGRVRFQLQNEGRVNIEAAEFDFASGTLAMQQNTITLGADETRFVLTLRDVDATSLLRDLNVRDLSVTGNIEGTFPLRLTRRSAFVDHGVLHATGGGTISYTGNAGANATGSARIAFDALREFRYETLALTLDGDLNGDVVSEINFRGQNSGEPVDLGEIAQVPGLGRVTVRGVPFVFNVNVTAPFRRLAETAATITDPASLIRRGQQNEQVDPSPEPPR